MKYTLSLLLISSLLVVQAGAEEVRTLDRTQVTAMRDDHVLRAAEQNELEVPGNTEVVEEEDWAGRGLQLADVFALSPTVNVEEEGVGNDVRLSIRGSAVQSPRGNRGVGIQVDGVPANSVDGAFFGNTVQPLTLQQAKVFPGANGLAEGGSQFGGVIDFKLRNGLNAPGVFVQSDYGSDATVRSSLQYGAQGEQVDVFAALTHAHSDGHRDHSAWDSTHFTGNVGYAWNDEVFTRLYLTLLEEETEAAGRLTRAQFEQDPEQRQTGLDDASMRSSEAVRIAQRTDWNHGDNDYTVYGYFQRFQSESFQRVNRMPRPMQDGMNLDLKEFGVGFKSEHRWLLAGKEQRTQVALRFDTGRNLLSGNRGPNELNQRDEAENVTLYAENQTRWNQKHKLSYGLGWTTVRRTHEDKRAVPPPARNDYAENQDGGVWRVGYLYEPTKLVQLFANVSQSFEAAPFSVIDNGGLLDPQKALNYELGSRFEKEWLKGSVAAYWADFEGEYVRFEVDPNRGIYAFTNADTIHRGIEASFIADLLELCGQQSEYQLKWKGSYQLNDFEFDGGASEGNQMPGISRHVYSSKISFSTPEEKWAASLAVRYLPEGYVADNDNTIHTPGFATWKLAANYKVTDTLSLYGGVDNLFDKHYIARVGQNPRGPAFITPGKGRTAYIGVKALW